MNIHVVGVVALCWALWKLRNRACFELKLIKNPAEIICYACSFLKYWASLQLGADKTDILAGAEDLQALAISISSSPSQSPDALLLRRSPDQSNGTRA